MRFLIYCTALLAATFPAGAQGRAEPRDPSFDVALGVTMNTPEDVNQRPHCTDLALPCLTPRTFPDFGATLQLAVAAAPHVAVVAEGSIYLNRWDTTSATSVADRRENHVSAALIGVRLGSALLHRSSSGEGGFRVFGQVLAGREASTVVPTRFAVQPGASVDIRFPNSPLYVRGGADYRWTRGTPRNLSGSRLLIALASTVGE